MSSSPASSSPAFPVQAAHKVSGSKQTTVVLVLATLSTLVAFVVDAAQRRRLGDEPAMMILTGCVLAVVAGRLRLASPVLLGFASMAGFPIWAAIDVARNGGHNLLPFEFAIYAVYGGIGAVVAWIARRLKSSATTS